MRTYTITELKKETSSVFEQMGRDHFALITQNGKPKTIMLDIEEQDLELVLLELRRMRGRLAVDAMRRRSRELGNDRLSIQEVESLIRDADGQPA
jgi:PHD/YefM family antitoxin component YafN of YafNO toxin-antitoxin module